MSFAYYNIAIASFIIFGWGSWLFPGSDMTISIGLVGFLVDLPIIVAYSFLAMGMPRSGGDYVYVSRGICGPMGFAVALVFLIYLTTFSVGQNAWFAVATALSPSLAVIGSVTNSSEILGLASAVVQPNTAIVLGLILVAVTFIFTLIPTSALHRVMLVLFIVAFLGFPVLYIAQLAVSTNGQFVQAFNTHAAAYGTSYTDIIQKAQDAGAVLAQPSIAASLAALPIVYATLAFPQSATYIGGEMKSATKQIPRALALGVIGICVITAIMGVLTYNVFGYKFMEATAFYGFSGAPGYPLPAAPFTNYFIGILNPNPAFTWFLLISAMAWELLLMITFSLMSSRAIFALAFDGAAPHSLADISERFHTPVKANVLATIGAIVFLVLTAYNFLGTYVNSIVAWTSGYLVVMVAAAIFPFVNKKLFEQFPDTAKKRVGGVPAITIAGVLGIMSLLVVFYYLLINPSVSGASTTGLTIVGITYIVGIVLYMLAKAYRKRQGVDLGLVYKQIPPE